MTTWIFSSSILILIFVGLRTAMKRRVAPKLAITAICAILITATAAGCTSTKSSTISIPDIEAEDRSSRQTAVIQADASSEEEILPEIPSNESANSDEALQSVAMSSFFTDTVDWELDVLSARISIILSDGSEVVYPLSAELAEAVSQFNEKERMLYEDPMNCISYGNRIMLFLPPLLGDATVVFSEDSGNTWQEETVPGTYGTDVTGSYLGDIPGGGTWLVLQGAVGAGMVYNTLYLKTPGDKWLQNDAFASIEPRQIDYVTFLSENVGFISVGAGWYGRYPYLYCSTDGGTTWKQCAIIAPQQDGYVGIDSIISVNGGFELRCSSRVNKEEGLEEYVSTDGRTWTPQ